MKTLANKVAVITGGSSGIGFAIAKKYAENGATVIITGRDQRKLDAAVAALGGSTSGIKADIAVLADIEKCYKEVAKKTGKIDVLVLNAAIAPTNSLADYTEEMFDNIINVNLKGTFFSVQMALPYLKDGASIIITGASVINKGFDKFSVYAASKAALRSLTRSFSTELLDRKIRVNMVSPGATDTPILFTGGLNQEQVDQVKSYMAEITPIKYIASPEEIAGAYLFLASDDSKYMIGSEIAVDGGISTL